jgi:SAM-dependent methyltransferase
MSSNEIETREAEFWDHHALQLSEADLLATRTTLTKEESVRVELLGDLVGKRVLDVGCGSGEWAVILASRGAIVTAIDISPEMVAATNRRAALSGYADRISATTMSALDLKFADGSFDVVHGQDIIHHLDPGLFGKEVSRVLAVGGRAAFRENNGNNPILMFARDRICGRFGIAKWSSDDEYPLTPKRLRDFTRNFEHCALRFPEFIMFHLFDAKVFHYRVKLVSRICRGLDELLSHTPLRRYSYSFLLGVVR